SYTYPTTTTITSGNFLGQLSKYIGVKFDISGDTHYGWINIDMASSGNFLMVNSYAYNDVPDQAIKAGQTVGIADQELNDVSIYGYGNQIHISGTKGKTEIFDLQGQQVHQEGINGSTSITLKEGIYLVRVTSEGRSVTKKVYLN
ncbi:MAG: T9SS type A sorting domain-containing protein, partial [Bacteroidetes bacterium]|nr:T9SS type A sorting domain-containing protein [Bacteroidota bacterium]